MEAMIEIINLQVIVCTISGLYILLKLSLRSQNEDFRLLSTVLLRSMNTALGKKNIHSAIISFL